MQRQTTTKKHLFCRGTRYKRGSLRATRSEYIKNHIKESNCFVQPHLFGTRHITSVKHLYFFSSIPLHLVHVKVERIRGHPKLFKLACVSITVYKNTTNNVVVMFNIALANTTRKKEIC